MKNQISKHLMNDIDELERLSKPYGDLLTSSKHAEELLQHSALARMHEDQFIQALEAAKSLQDSMGAGYLAAMDNFHTIGGVALQHALEAQDALTALQESAMIATGYDLAPSSIVEKALVEAETAARYFQNPVGIEESFFSSINDFQSFATSQLEHLSTDSELIAARRLAVTGLSGDLFDLVNNSLLLTGELYSASDHEVDLYVPAPYEPRLFAAVNEDIDHVYHDDFKGDVGEEFEKVAPVKLAKIGSGIIETVVQINEKQVRKGRDEIFKPTTKVLQASVRIPSAQVFTEDEFYIVVDYLFFMIYEGSGGSNNRIMGYLSATDPILDALWKLKHLRLGARHDLDHGDTKVIRQKFQKVGDAYKFLIGKVKPETPREWQKTQLALYQHLLAMLSAIHDTIR